MKRTLLAAATAALLAPAAFSADVDWTRDPVAQSMPDLRKSLKPMPKAAEIRRAVQSAAGEATSYFKGTLKLQSETRSFCFTLSPKVIDQFEGDPDMEGHGFIHQEIPMFRDDGKTVCESSLQHNGGYIRTCGGLFLYGASSLTKGDVFDRQERYDGHTGELIVKPVGSYSLEKVGSCGGQDMVTDSKRPNIAFPVSDAMLREVGVLLADRANMEQGQTMVGEMVEYQCTASKDSAKARCHFTYNLDRSICWFGHEHLKADLPLDHPRDTSNVEHTWTRD